MKEVAGADVLIGSGNNLVAAHSFVSKEFLLGATAEQESLQACVAFFFFSFFIASCAHVICDCDCVFSWF